MNVLYGVSAVAALVILVFAIRPAWLSKFLYYVAQDQMPIWLSIGLAVSAAAGTYWLAPLINQDFEFQKNRSAHLLQTVTDLNKINVELAVDTRKFNDAIFYEKKQSIKSVRGSLLDKITELQWRLLDVDVVIHRAGADASCVKAFSSDLDLLKSAVVEASKPEDQEPVIEASKKVADSAQSCMRVLYRAANLDAS